MFENQTWGSARAALLGAVIWLGGSQAARGESPPTVGREEIRCAGAVCSIGACVTQRLLTEPEKAARALRIVPAFVDGQARGFKLFAIRPGTWPAQLGLLNGDTLLRLNGQEIATPEKASAAYKSLQTVKDFAVALERRGQPLTLQVHLDRRPIKDGECPPAAEAAAPVDPPASAPGPVLDEKGRAKAAAASLRSIAKDISCKGTHCTLRNGVIDRVLENPLLFNDGGRVIPVVQNGKVVGIALMAVRTGSLWSLLGLKNGDRLRTLNEYDLTAPDKALEAYAKLRNATDLSLVLDRAGAPLTLTYELKR